MIKAPVSGSVEDELEILNSGVGSSCDRQIADSPAAMRTQPSAEEATDLQFTFGALFEDQFAPESVEE